MVSYHRGKFGSNRHCVSRGIVFLVVEEHDSTSLLQSVSTVYF